MGNEWQTPEDCFGRNLRRFREEAGLSQQQLAAALADYGVTLHPSAIAKMELRDANSPRTIRLNEADAVARALGKSIPEMLTGRDAALSELLQEAEEAARLAGQVRQARADLEARVTALYGLDKESQLSPEAAATQAKLAAALGRIDGADIESDGQTTTYRIKGQSMPIQEFEEFQREWERG